MQREIRGRSKRLHIMSGRDVASVTQDALLGDRECCGPSGTVPCFAHVTAERVRQHGGGPLAMTGPGREPRTLSFRKRRGPTS